MNGTKTNELGHIGTPVMMFPPRRIGSQDHEAIKKCKLLSEGEKHLLIAALVQLSRVVVYASFVTPDDVDTIDLTKNYRDISVFKRYANLMRMGEWVPGGGGPLMFDSDRVCFEGGNRLKAVKESGKPQVFLIMEGCLPDIALVLDNPSKRTWGQHITHHRPGINQPNKRAAALRRILLGDRERTFLITDPMVPVYYDMFEEAIDFVIDLFKSEKTLSCVGLIGAYARAFLYYDTPEQRERLRQILIDFRDNNLDAMSESMRILRNDIDTLNFGTGGGDAPDLYLRGAAAIQAAMEPERNLTVTGIQPHYNKSRRVRAIVRPKMDPFKMKDEPVELLEIKERESALKSTYGVISTNMTEPDIQKIIEMEHAEQEKPRDKASKR